MREQLPTNPQAALAAVRAQTRHVLPQLADDDRVILSQGEGWTARKLVRRTLWHERDHLKQIAHLVANEARALEP